MNTVKAFYLQDGYATPRGLTGWYRDLTIREAKTCCATAYAIDWKGNVREVRITSRQTWKTRPGCVLSLKYGLRNSFKAGSDMAPEDSPVCEGNNKAARVVVPVKHQFLPETPPEIVADFAMQYEIA